MILHDTFLFKEAEVNDLTFKFWLFYAGELQRKIGLKVLEMGGTAVLG